MIFVSLTKRFVSARWYYFFLLLSFTNENILKRWKYFRAEEIKKCSSLAKCLFWCPVTCVFEREKSCIWYIRRRDLSAFRRRRCFLAISYVIQILEFPHFPSSFILRSYLIFRLSVPKKHWKQWENDSTLTTPCGKLNYKH